MELSSINRHKILFLGGRELGYRVLKWLVMDLRFQVVGVSLINEKDTKIEVMIQKLLKDYHLKEIDISDIDKLDFSTGLSVNYDKIINQKVIDYAPNGFWNVHHSYNMRLRGRNITTHAILESKNKIHYHGTSIHKIVKKLDAGPILASIATTIYDFDTAFTLFSRVNDLAFNLITEWVPRICFEKVYPYAGPSDGVKYFKNKDLPSKSLDISIPDDIFYNYVRAFDFPGFSPAYITIQDEKAELVLFKRDCYIHEVKVKNMIFYSNIKI